MKNALFLLLLLGLLLMGCREAPEAEALAPAAQPTVCPTAQPMAEKELAISAAPATPSPTVPPTPEPTPLATPSATPVPKPTSVPGPTPFTIVWMSDTQILSRDYPEAFNSMRDWILENREAENIQFVIHTGDVVDAIGPAMYENAATALVPIFEALPGMIVSGNHDVAKNNSQYYFLHQPYTKLVIKDSQTYTNGSAIYASYVTFRAGDTDFLVFGIGYEVICTTWMNEIIAKYPNHVVITVLHRGLQPTGEYFKETRAIYLKVMPKWPNFRLILCGHERGSLTHTDWFDDDGDEIVDRSVTTMMFNYQDDRKNGLGFIRLLRFNPLDHSIEVLTYSPWYDKWGYSKAKPEENHFVLLNAW